MCRQVRTYVDRSRDDEMIIIELRYESLLVCTFARIPLNNKSKNTIEQPYQYANLTNNFVSHTHVFENTNLQKQHYVKQLTSCAYAASSKCYKKAVTYLLSTYLRTTLHIRTIYLPCQIIVPHNLLHYRPPILIYFIYGDATDLVISASAPQSLESLIYTLRQPYIQAWLRLSNNNNFVEEHAINTENYVCMWIPHYTVQLDLNHLKYQYIAALSRNHFYSKVLLNNPYTKYKIIKLNKVIKLSIFQ